MFDVSAGAHFYGPDAPYHIFAGRDGSKSLPTGSLEKDDVENPDLSDFGARETLELEEQVEFYSGKYVRVGKLEGWVPPPPESYVAARELREKRKQDEVERKKKRAERKRRKEEAARRREQNRKAGL